MIVSVTPNPSLDRTLHVPPWERGELVRALSASSEAGGKGLNLARALHASGVPTRAVLPLAPASEAILRSLLPDDELLEAVPIRGALRVNLSLVEADGTVTKVNEPGPHLSAAEADALLQRTLRQADGAAWIAGCGSLPPGMGTDWYARLVARASPRARVAIDADGEALALAVRAGPALLKPNRAELEGLLGRRLRRLSAVVDGARELLAAGVGAVLVSLGPDGALLVDGDGARHAEAPGIEVVNSVGAGDSLLAGFLAGGAAPSALAEAVAWSVAACRSSGTAHGPARDADRARVVVHPRPHPDRVLVA